MDPANQVKLCGVQGCCLAVSKTNNQVTITDDNGGQVVLTVEQWEDLRAKMADGTL